MNCYHERNSPFDRFAIKCCVAGKEELVGHIPNEISRVIKFFIARGAAITARLVENHHRRPPLVEGRLDAPCKLTATIPGTVSNLLCVEKYKKIVINLYIKSKNEEILGFFFSQKIMHPFL